MKERYFHTLGSRHWVFCGDVRGPKGRPLAVHLYAAHGLHITRHTKIENRVNPYDPRWEVYIEERLGLKMTASLQGRHTLLSLWKRQNGRCAHCGDTITTITGWHNHHKVWRSQGGSDALSNRVLLHPTCHRQVHHPHGSPGVPHPLTGMVRKA